MESLIGRLATDAALRRRFEDAPTAFLKELAEEGFELTAVEQKALAALDRRALKRFAESLDRRLARAPLGAISQEG
ncbi:MAG: Os1348 family NHLP clan protein [Vicinamibacteria bacterium]